MSTNTSSKEIANIRVMHKLYQEGLLNDDSFAAIKKVLRPAASWYKWVKRLLLFFGSALLLAGIIFFFAYNWAKMGKFLKFGLIELGIIACVTFSYLYGMTRLSGKTLLLSASVLVGVLLAVYGQIYQTGADAFELFRGWAFLILGWVVISEFAPLWFLWLAIINTGAIFFWKQVGQPSHHIPYEWLCLAIACLDGLALVLREIGVTYCIKWLTGKWLRTLLLLATLISLSVPTIHLIVDFERTNSIAALVSSMWVLVTLGGYICYRYKLRDMIPLAIIVMNGCIILLTLIGKFLYRNSHFEASISLLFAFIILSVASGATFWLRKTNAEMAVEIKGENI